MTHYESCETSYVRKKSGEILWLESRDPKPGEKPIEYDPASASYIPALEFNPQTGSVCWKVINLDTKSQEIFDRRVVSDLLLAAAEEDWKPPFKPA